MYTCTHTYIYIAEVYDIYQQEIRNFHHISPTRHEDIQGLKGSNFVMPSSSFRKSFTLFKQYNEHLSKCVMIFFRSQFTRKKLPSRSNDLSPKKNKGLFWHR